MVPKVWSKVHPQLWCQSCGASTIDMERINSQHVTVRMNRRWPIINPGGRDWQSTWRGLTVNISQSIWIGDHLASILGGLTINIEMINSHHLTVCMNRQFPIINLCGGGDWQSTLEVIGTVYRNYHCSVLTLFYYIFSDLPRRSCGTQAQEHTCPTQTYACLVKYNSK